MRNRKFLYIVTFLIAIISSPVLLGSIPTDSKNRDSLGFVNDSNSINEINYNNSSTSIDSTNPDVNLSLQIDNALKSSKPNKNIWHSILFEFSILFFWFLFIIALLYQPPIRKLIDRIRSIKVFGMDIVIVEGKLTTIEFIKSLDFRSSKDGKSLKDLPELAEEVKRLFNLAYDSTNKGCHELATQYLKQANRILPNQIFILHNLGTCLLRLGNANLKTDNNNQCISRSYPSIEVFIEAESVCQKALHVYEQFPYGTFYNLARAQAGAGNISGIKETFVQMMKIKLPEDLAKTFAKRKGDEDFSRYPDICELNEYKNLRDHLRKKYNNDSDGK